ncbi:c-type cytochrome [Pseudomonas sp. DR48]|nr:c-type cytochrome [Pseudomonas sp. DR48]
METCGNKRTFNRLHRVVALCAVALMSCTSTKEDTSQEVSPMPGIAMADQVCSLCHGLTGESVSPLFPKLAGQQKEYLKLQLSDFKLHTRSDKTGAQYMSGLTHLTETQIKELADYFSSQSPMKADVGASDARGESIFRNGIPESGVARCSACHGAGGEGKGAVPRLAGQHADYVVSQMKVLGQTDQRPRGAQMKRENHSLSDADAQFVAHYLATLGAKTQ